MVTTNGKSINNHNTLQQWADAIHRWGVEKGWAEPELDTRDIEKVKGIIIEKLLMMHTEITEATEALREIDFSSPNWLSALRRSTTAADGKPEGLPSELIDLIIRALHLIAIIGIDANGEMSMKMLYNYLRPHRHGGKNL